MQESDLMEQIASLEDQLQEQQQLQEQTEHDYKQEIDDLTETCLQEIESKDLEIDQLQQEIEAL